MGRRAGRALAAAAVAGAALAVPGQAQAQPLAEPAAAPAAVSFASAMYATVTGLPATLGVGGTIDLTVDMRWESVFPVDITGLGISMSGPATGVPPTRGISVLWQDPRTGAWRASDKVDAADGIWSITEPKRTVFIRANGTLAVHLKITMTASAAAGTEHVDAGQFAYLDAAEGAVLRGTVTSHDFRGSFQFGDPGGSGGKPTPTASAPPSAPTLVTAGPTATASAAATAPQTVPPPGSAAISTVPVGNAGAASGPKPPAAAPSLPPPNGTVPPQTITEANIVGRGANGMSTLGAVVVLLTFLAGSVLVILRSRRDEAAAAAGAAAAPPNPEPEPEPERESEHEG